jgi:hypothetical protein
MPTLLTKSSFTSYLESPIRLWLEQIRPDLLPPKDPALERIFEQGHIVDDFSRGLYPGGAVVEGYNETGYANTQKAIADGAKILYQPTAVAKGMSARGDILVKGKSGKWDIHEVKSSTQVKPENYYDVAFQRFCFESAGIPIGKTYLTHINNQYIRQGEVDVQQLFTEEDITEDVLAITPEVMELIPKAMEVLSWPKELDEAHLRLGGNPADSDAVIYWLNNLAPKDRELALARMNPFKIGKMLEQGKITPKGLSENFLISYGYQPPDLRWPKKIDVQKITAELDSLTYPLYFYDYETYSSAIPAFDGYRPYQQIPFQFSLAIQDTPEAELRIHDFLMPTFEDPAPSLIRALHEYFGPKGNVISWNAMFEKGRNQELATMYPEHADFLLDLNDRTYDLMQIFKKKLYVHPEFLGSSSLKKVMPVLIPSLSYKNLNIQEGGEASASWLPITDPKLPKKQKEQLIKDEIEYCRLDVMAMVKILEFLQKL